ncbi:MAG: DNA-binding response regulator, partial [Aquificota bacterium]
MDSVRVFIVDDHSLFREGLKRILADEGGDRFQVVGEAAKGEEAVQKVREIKPA